MIATAKPSPVNSSHSNDEQAACHDQFLSLLPAIRRHARVAFRHKGAEAREEDCNATIAHAWAAFVRLFELGRVELAYAGPLAAYAIARMREGRSIGNRLNSRDVTSIHCQRRHGVQIRSLHEHDGRDTWRELVVEDRRSGPADIVATRIDFAEWLLSLSCRQREIAEALAAGHETRLVASMFRVSPGRVSQLRKVLHKAWCNFQGDVTSAQLPSAKCA
jgi:hypothetical protein